MCSRCSNSVSSACSASPQQTRTVKCKQPPQSFLRTIRRVMPYHLIRRRIPQQKINDLCRCLRGGRLQTSQTQFQYDWQNACAQPVAQHPDSYIQTDFVSIFETVTDHLG